MERKETSCDTYFASRCCEWKRLLNLLFHRNNDDRRRLFIMNQYFVLLKENARSIKNVHTICGVALFFALNVVLNLVGSIQITNELKLGFASVATAASCFLYGPVPNLILAPLLDFVNFIVKPVGSYYPIFMISTIATTCIFSFFFYGQEKISWSRIILCRISYDVIVSLFLNSLFTAMLWGTPFWTIVTPKLIKNLLSLPFQVIILYLVMKACKQLKTRVNL